MITRKQIKHFKINNKKFNLTRGDSNTRFMPTKSYKIVFFKYFFFKKEFI
jgi:hypothetical protein